MGSVVIAVAAIVTTILFQLVISSLSDRVFPIIQLRPNQEVNLINGLAVQQSVDSKNNSYASSWLIGDSIKCSLNLETLYPDETVNSSFYSLVISYQIKGQQPVQLWIDHSDNLFSRKYSVDLPLIKGKFRLLIDISSKSSFNYSGSNLIKNFEIDRCWSTYQACPVLSCTNDGFNAISACIFAPALSFNCSTDGLCVHKDEVCDFETNCPDASDEADCPSSLRCSFETDYCNWKPVPAQINSRNCFWGTCAFDRGLVRTQAARSLQLGPTLDHTLESPEGHYLILRSNGKHEMSMGSIASELRIKGKCKLVLFYRTNSRSGQLLIRSSDKATTASNPFSTIEVVDLDWEKSLFSKVEVEVDLGDSAGEWVFIVAIVKGEDNSYLAIDDIYFTKGCSLSPSWST